LPVGEGAEDAGPLAPGTVILALSHGHRLESWWENMNAFADEVLERRHDDGWDPFD
jgi:hypothetical protein